MKILYFSGTGNSLYIAKSIASNLNGEVVSIPKEIKTQSYDIESDIIGFVIPIYYLDIPNMVDEYLMKLKIKSDYTFFIFTYAGTAFETKHFANRYNFNVDYTAQIKMASNYLIWGDMKYTNSRVDNYDNELMDLTKNIKSRVKKIISVII